MEVIPLRVNDDISTEFIPAVIDEAIVEMGYTMTLRSSLRAYPNSVHWHVRRPKETGTLEITFDPATRTAWFSCRAGRTKAWVREAIEDIQEFIDD